MAARARRRLATTRQKMTDDLVARRRTCRMGRRPPRRSRLDDPAAIGSVLRLHRTSDPGRLRQEPWE